MKLCLNMIVKNEQNRIVRALDSVAQFIDCYVITDTGSTDDTPKIIKDYFKARGIPGHVTHAPFVTWSQARNAALIAARAALPRLQWDYAILMDADMELVVKDFEKFKDALQGGLSYDMEQRAGTLHYLNRRIVSATAKGLYLGVTHEYLDVHSAGSITPDVAYFADHADGSNRPEKFKRDIALLLAGIEKDPTNSRYFYYLAQSYRDAGQIDEAMKWYKARVDAGGWPEEQWSAQYHYAHCFKDKGNEAEFVNNMLIAYNMRPSRAETMYDLATYFRHKDNRQPVAALFAEIGMRTPQTTDALFVNNYVYESGLKEEFAITGFYVPHKKQDAFRACDALSLQPGPYPMARATARANLFWYLPTLKDVCPSFTWKQIPFTPPENWTALNPSVTLHCGRAYCVVRTVNYRIDEHGRYLIRSTDGTANDSNPINTRNFLLDMGFDPMSDTGPGVREILAPRDLPCEFKPVIGFEDMRLFSHQGELWTSSCVRQIHPDGNCEQVLARLVDPPDGGPAHVVAVHRMLREPRATEKNWAPIPNAATGTEVLFMHRPGVVVDQDGKTIIDRAPKLTTDILSGSSQLIPFAGNWLALLHTAHQLPNSPCRYYYHRFALYNGTTFELQALSTPFVFNDKVIEFAAGLCFDPMNSNKLVISYGYQDNEARIATVAVDEVMRALCSKS